MKLLSLYLIASVSVSNAVSIPAANPEPELDAANKRQTNTTTKCSISGTFATVSCRASPTRSSSALKSFRPGQEFGVECMVDGEGIDGEKYVPSLVMP